MYQSIHCTAIAIDSSSTVDLSWVEGHLVVNASRAILSNLRHPPQSSRKLDGKNDAMFCVMESKKRHQGGTTNDILLE